MNNFRKSARALAFASLVRCEREKRFVNLEINSTLRQNSLDAREKSLYTALVYSGIEKAILLDYILKDFVKAPIESLDLEVRCALRLGASQLVFFDRLPDHAVLSETVEIIKNTRCRSASGLVNAVLRAIARDKKAVTEKIETAPLHIKYSFPEWIVSTWQSCYGEKKTLEILEGFSHEASTILHVNTLKTSVDEYLDALLKSGASAERVTSHPELLVPENAGGCEELFGYEDGLFFVQGTASALAVSDLAPKPDSLLVDVCACPGGKSFAAAIAMKNRGKIYSFDLHESKLSLVERGAERLGISIIEALCHDAREDFGNLVGRADYVIADVPCSGLGVISKKPDIRAKKEEDILRLPEIQSAILENASTLLKRGGRLLYSTCTLNCAENENVTNKFLEAHPEFKREEGFPKTCFPGEASEDGFFSDILIRV